MATFYQPRLVNQLDGSRFQGENCNMASGATLLDRHTLGARRSTGAKMRSLQFDQSGGTDLNDLDTAWRRGYRQDLDVRLHIPWNDVVALVRSGRAMVLQLWYGDLGVYRNQLNFFGNHSIEVNEIALMKLPSGASVLGGKMFDPLGHAPRWVPLSILEKSAGNLKFISGKRCGFGYAYAGFARRIGIYSTAPSPNPKPPPGSVPTLILTKPPTPKEPDVMIPGSGLVRSSSHVMSLKKGQRLYKSPGGSIAANMQKDAKVEYFGTAGTGWRCVEISTGSPYADHVTRPTLVYVPAAAGPVTRK